MKTSHLIIALLFVLISTNIKSQCIENNTFKVGEIITYKAVYNWGFIWVDAGEVTFEVDKTEYKGKNVMHLKSFGRSLQKHDWFFKVRDYFDSYIDSSDLSPQKFVRNTFEGGYTVNNRYYFNHSNKKVYTFSENSDKPLEKDTFSLSGCTYDLLSAIYYVRCIDYTKAKKNETIPISLIVDNELVSLYIRYLGEEVVKNPETNEKYNAIKFTVKMMEGTIFSGGEDITVWVTNDKNKIPILVEAKVLVGSVKAILQTHSGLRHPFTSKIK